MFSAFQYILYFLKKEDRHSLQSPFAFKMYDGLRNHLKIVRYPEIEKIRTAFLKDPTEIQVTDYGAGSKKVPHAKRKVKEVAQYSNSPIKYNLLYQYFLKQTPAQNALELGTGLGINSAYLAAEVKNKLITIEADKAICQLAASHLEKLKNVEVVCEEIDHVLPFIASKFTSLDFLLIDANHTYEATIKYFNILLPFLHETSIVIVGDIYWSKGMKKAWEKIKGHSKVRMTFDFFECGVVFFKKDLQKEHYILTY
ncbi:class I SAM-dependent methyltransferase [Litoribacter alkaliphilus]|uniref:Class I SAM-dependent methyltransferase n=1 Tax=Litoribacter ruber TaxID=702568 RepID=A0AAP2CET6_9BACT|nr:class I SAM-dependent methyltransferase [Litoribacter alkaliphilus]MBS9523213.1 class I SAM-dependent methyltransferase [Litoribacter alkaliphilus]